MKCKILTKTLLFTLLSSIAQGSVIDELVLSPTGTMGIHCSAVAGLSKTELENLGLKEKIVNFNPLNTAPSYIAAYVENECRDFHNKKTESMLNHTISLNDYFVNSTQTPVKCNILNPSLFEVSASRIAYYLFPKNFAKYTFILQHKDADKNNVNAGYFFDSYLIEHCTDYNALDGIENVYATAFYLGLEIRSHLCIKENDKQYLYIDDFSHAFHKVSAKCERVSSEYRDHKIFPLEKGTLFPTAFMGTDCGVWLNATCNTTRLENAYLKIMNASQKEIDSMIDIAMDALKAIECPDNDCSFIEHYKYMDNVKALLSHNQQAISELYERYKNGTSLSDTERKTCDEDEYPTDYDPDL